MQHCTRCVVLMTLAWSITGVAQETQRPHTYVFAQPEMVSAQRVFGVGNAAMLLGQACAEFPEAAASYAHWLERNQATMQQLTNTLAAHYRIPVTDDGLQARVAAAMHLKTVLSLSAATSDEVCPTLPDTLALPNMDLQQRYRESLIEVRDPNYLNPKRKSATTPKPAATTEDTP